MDKIGVNMKRVEANDPLAISHAASKCYLRGDFDAAFKYMTKAAALGGIEAHYSLSLYYRHGGHGVEKNEKKEVYHMEEAAIGGHAEARCHLACHEGENGSHERAMKHFIIAAKLGHDEALDKVKMGFVRGYVSKEDYEAALRGHQAAVDATKSKQREVAKKFNGGNWYDKKVTSIVSAFEASYGTRK
jgi:TPR repeat protein